MFKQYWDPEKNHVSVGYASEPPRGVDTQDMESFTTTTPGGGMEMLNRFQIYMCVCLCKNKQTLFPNIKLHKLRQYHPHELDVNKQKLAEVQHHDEVCVCDL